MDQKPSLGEAALRTVTERHALDFSTLTGREVEVLLLLASGEQNRWLARRLGIAERTVRAHTSSIVRKLELKSRFEAAIVSHLYTDDIKCQAGVHSSAA
ncbi:helix-turn-helix transcriptional regulator [Streptomyces sp. NPDC004111]|uniref:helix-turn-helix domain-containing protein n=1 Tax=Streptomyces sp. NPDC004111 TaxID=3364690 RepID=UPI00368DE7B5